MNFRLGGFLSALPEPVVIHDFYTKTGAGVGAEQVITELIATELVTFTLVKNYFCRLPVLFIK